MSKSDIKKINKSISEFEPGFSGIETREGIEQYYQMPKSKRQKLITIFDRDYRDKGSLSIGQARLGIADQNQLNSLELGLQNVGQYDLNRPDIRDSLHPSYPVGIPGQPVGKLPENISLFDLNPGVLRQWGIVDALNPKTLAPGGYNAARYTAQLTRPDVSTGIITEDVIKNVNSNREKRNKLDAMMQELNLDGL